MKVKTTGNAMKFLFTMDKKLDEENNTYISNVSKSEDLTQQMHDFEQRLESHIESLIPGIFTEIDQL